MTIRQVRLPVLRIKAKHDEKLGITYFGLQGHEVALLESLIKRAEILSAQYELRDPNHAGSCNIVLVNRDSRTAKSWWKTYKKQNPTAVPLFLTDSRVDPDSSAICKRPFSPSFLEAAFQGLAAATPS